MFVNLDELNRRKNEREYRFYNKALVKGQAHCDARAKKEGKERIIVKMSDVEFAPITLNGVRNDNGRLYAYGVDGLLIDAEGMDTEQFFSLTFALKTQHPDMFYLMEGLRVGSLTTDLNDPRHHVVYADQAEQFIALTTSRRSHLRLVRKGEDPSSPQSTLF